jgi:hypothetical protein
MARPATAAVPALRTSNWPASILSRPICRRCSATGDRQTLPVHPVRIRYGADYSIELHTSNKSGDFGGVRTC